MVTILEAGRAEKNYWRDLWHYREVFQVLAWRDVSVRYKQKVIGVAWALIRPFLTIIVFTVFFVKGANPQLTGDRINPQSRPNHLVEGKLKAEIVRLQLLAFPILVSPLPRISSSSLGETRFCVPRPSDSMRDASDPTGAGRNRLCERSVPLEIVENSRWERFPIRELAQHPLG
jgi:hypothetical protein